MNTVKHDSFSFYSARPGTPAFNLETLKSKEARDRLYNFQKVADEIKLNMKNLINNVLKVLLRIRQKM